MDEPIRILLVDDEARNLDALEAILDEPGYQLVRADNADLALRELLEHEIAAIVLDIKMPGVSGFELARLIKGTKKFRQIPIVFLTAYMLEDADVIAGYGAGAVDYLTKPVNPAVLRHKIAVFADLFRKTRALAQLNETLEERVRERTAELEKSEAALRAADQHKDQFLATLAHELRNPLAPLRTGVDLLMSRGDAPISSSQRALDAMSRQLDHMVRLIDDLLDVSRISRGILELRKDRTDLNAIVQQAIDSAKPFYDKRKQAMEFRSTGEVFAELDPTRIAQVIGNLLHNASKFSPDGAVVKVELDGTRVRVIDTGVGLEPAQLERVFEMFSQVRRAAPSGSTGLGIGLSLARKLAELHGGTLTAASAGEGQGCTFTLQLPSAAVVTQPAAEVKPARAAANRLAIVVIEDNDDAADTLAMWLEDMGHDVKVARTGPEGLRLVVSAPPDLVLCDIGLPEMDGNEVCRQIRAAGPAPVLVALTGWGMDADRAKTREAGFDHHLVKPVAPDKLRAILAAVRPN